MVKVRKMFSGNNTARGFYSFYEELINFAENGVFILKGGPGTGKSTLMRKVGETAFQQGYDLEYHYCSSDPFSIDALLIPELALAILDGTRPHIVDPQNPGAVEQLINLGEFWEVELLMTQKEKIKILNQQKGFFFRLAYNHLQEAEVIKRELQYYYQCALNKVGWWPFFRETITRAFGEFTPPVKRLPLIRSLFASANTPDGYLSYFGSILQGVKNLYLLNGGWEIGKAAFLKKIAAWGISLGFDCEKYHCPFDPLNLELVFFPDLKLGFLSTRSFFEYWGLTGQVLDFDQFISFKKLAEFKREIGLAEKRLTAVHEQAWQKLDQARSVHQQLEKIYFPAISIEKLEALGEKLVNYFFKLSQGD